MGAAVFDRDMRYLAHNDAWLVAHGGDLDARLLGKNHYEAFPEVDSAWRSLVARCLEGAHEQKMSGTLVDAKGRRHTLRWAIEPWHIEDDQVGGVVVYAENITDQVTTQRRLDERESLIREFFDRSPIGLNLCTMDGLWLESNRAFLDIIGYSPEEADGGLTYWQLTPPRYHAQEATQLASLKAHKRYGPYEKEFIRKDGRLVPVRLEGFIVERDGTEYIWSLIEDLTAQRELEKRLEEERLKAIQASKLSLLGEMAAGIAHEINNPLTIIAGNTYLLRDAVASGDEAVTAEALDAIEEVTKRAVRIVQGLKKFSRQGANDPTEELAVATIISDAIDLCRASSRTHGVDVTSDVDPRCRVRGHSVELSQVLVNLLSNGFDAAREASEPWVRVTCSHGDDGWVTIAVSNSGRRIDESVVPNLFRAFFTTKKVGEGTGLGLSISRSIAEGHGGTLDYAPEGPHTRFVLRLKALP